ncbi:MAG: metallophosphoesterase [Bacteroidota bacterium]|nr:metallophosphoesterase [Bacteroidota bacterium]
MQISNSIYKQLSAGKFLLIAVFGLISFHTNGQAKQPQLINMVFSSDAHFGLKKDKFRGDTNVNANLVNAAMISQMNAIPSLSLPADGGIGAGQQVGSVDYVIQTGDICNRMEPPVQSAAASWAQFETVYINGIKLTGHNGLPAKLLLAPGNHDISNAIGYTKLMVPATDPTSMVNIYNLMLKPKQPLTNENFDYTKDKTNYSVNVKGIHMMFITLWPDSAERIWMDKDLDTVKQKTPVIIFTHDQPTCEASHFTNPVPPHTINHVNKLQNLLTEEYKEGTVAAKEEDATNIEQRGFVKFLKKHPNIKAYFHGNSNWNEFYTYTGPDNDVKLNIFRVDSPMKGKYSAKDETKLSFQLISLDPEKQIITVRECLWNAHPENPNNKTLIGSSCTVSLSVDK